MIVIGGRQLALAILVHETTHRSLFKTRGLNDFVGRWICGGLVWQDLPRYREHHLNHHRLAGTPQDPDYSLIAAFPISRKSLLRKLLRDAAGVTGAKRVYGLLLMDLGYLTFTVAADPRPIGPSGKPFGDRLRSASRNLAPMLIANGFLFGVVAIAGKPWLYLLWVAAYLTTFSVFLRIRSIAEHACTRPGLEPLQSTRTTLANFVARATVAPHRVNFHLEHHLLMGAPHFRLPKIHHVLRDKGVYDIAFLAENYRQALRSATLRRE